MRVQYILFVLLFGSLASAQAQIITTIAGTGTRLFRRRGSRNFGKIGESGTFGY